MRFSTPTNTPHKLIQESKKLTLTIRPTSQALTA